MKMPVNIYGFISYMNVKRVRSLSIFISRVSAYRKEFDETKCMYLLIKDKE